METASFQISNSVVKITGLPEDGEGPPFQIWVMLDIRSCQLKKSPERRVPALPSMRER